MTVALVAGALANKVGNGGAAWTRLSWTLGMAQLGFDAHFVEQLEEEAEPTAEEWFLQVVNQFGLQERSTLLRRDGTSAWGLELDEVRELATEASVLLNLSGHLKQLDLINQVGTSVFVDLDPGYTQLWHQQGQIPLSPHDHWYTVGLNIGSSRCNVPTSGIPWRPIFQPVLLELWTSQPTCTSGLFTTVASWRGYGPIEHEGVILGPKAHEFRRFIDLPARAEGTFELALDIHLDEGTERAQFEAHGWRIVDPRDKAGDPRRFQNYIQESSAEWSVAQGMYARTETGWFSDRTTRYLASCRPAVVQDTGLSQHLPTGEGLFTFTTLEEAAAAVSCVMSEPARHARAARALAEEFFDSRKVLSRLCEEVGVAP